MNWSTLVTKLVEVAPGRAPTEGELYEAALGAAEDEEERELLADCADPWEALREMDPPTATVLSFLWKDGFGSAVEVQLIEAGGCGLLIQYDDSSAEENRILACVTFPRQPGVIARQLPRLRGSLVGVSPPDRIINHVPQLVPAAVVRRLGQRDPRAAFTTLGVPVFFAAFYAVAITAGFPLALLLSPLLLRLALVIVPPPTRLSLPTCPYLIRSHAEMAARAARRAAALRSGTTIVAPTAISTAQPVTPVVVPTVAAPAPATSADARVESPRRAA